MTTPAETDTPFHPRGVPLVVHDPYFSVWCMAERLTGDSPRHWTGASRGMCGLLRVDGKAFRFLGPEPEAVPPVEQVNLEVLPTRTVYGLETGGVSITLTFLSPLLPHDLDLVARPVTYVTWDVVSLDEQPHTVQLYLDCSMEWAVDSPDQLVCWNRSIARSLHFLRCGTMEQAVLSKSGDDRRIDWGYFYLAVPRAYGTSTAIARAQEARDRFCREGDLSAIDHPGAALPAADAPVMVCAFDLGAVEEELVSRRIMLAYNDLCSIEYMDAKLLPYWRRHGRRMEILLFRADHEYAPVLERCETFERELLEDMERVGGIRYRRLGALVVRMCLAGAKLVEGPDGSPWIFSKEHFSNGCIATVDVIYPASPFYLLFNPALLRGSLAPVLEYARSERWPFPFAPHDLGTYPQANGQVYGGGETSVVNQMPVEECGNMLLMFAALAQIEGDLSFAQEYWPLLSKWAGYLLQCGMDPADQLCTDDFAGRLTRNANLALKSILALGAYAKLAAALGKTEDADVYRQFAEEMAPQWMELAWDEDHYSLTFENPGTWSQKYNLVWDIILDLHLFPPEVARTELAFYKRQMNPFGVPLDSRHGYSKLDWSVWTATLAETPEDFALLLEPVYRFAAESPTWVPLPDRFWTADGSQAGRTRARSVVGGIMMPLLADGEGWRKWAGRAAKKP